MACKQSETAVSTDGKWISLKDTEANFTLHEQAKVYITFQLDAMAHGKRPTNDFGLTSLPDLLLARLLVNGIPFRQSGSNTSPNPFQKHPILHLRGGVSLVLGSGNHTVTLQWKKLGKAVEFYSSVPEGGNLQYTSRGIIVRKDENLLYSSSLEPQVPRLNLWKTIESLTHYSDRDRSLSGQYVLNARSFPNELTRRK